MKNLNKDDHSKFEKSWEEAFKGAELEPSEDVWLKIDNSLSKQESKGFKRTIILYKYAAAVSLILLLSTALVSYYFINFNAEAGQELTNGSHKKEDAVSQNEGLKDETTSHNPFSEDPNIAFMDGNANQEQHSEEIILENKEKAERQLSSKETEKTVIGKLAKENNKGNQNDGHTKVDKENKIFLSQSHDDSLNKLLSSDDKAAEEFDNENVKKTTSLAFLASKDFEPLEFKIVPLQNEIYRVPVVPVKDNKDEKSSASKGYFAGVQFTPGFFDPNIQMNTNKTNNVLLANRASYAVMGVNPSTQQQDLQPQVSYTYGLNFGMKLKKRWLLNMGVQYAKNNTTGTTQQFFDSDDNKRYLATPTTLSNDALESSNDMAFRGTSWTMNPIDLNNNFEFASIPVKAGFIIIDKKISWIISTGLATDFFLKNEIQDQSENFEKQVIKPGESSPFRNVFFNGLASSEIVFRFTENYSISLEPSFRTAISSFSKSESMISSLPQSFGVSAGFRFNF